MGLVVHNRPPILRDELAEFLRFLFGIRQVIFERGTNNEILGSPRGKECGQFEVLN